MSIIILLIFGICTIGIVILAQAAVAFDDKFYREFSETSAKYYREKKHSARIPMALAKKFDAKTYKKPLYGKTLNFHGGNEYTAKGQVMETKKSAPEYALGSFQAFSKFGPKENLEEGMFKKDTQNEQTRELADQVDLSYWKGIYEKGYDSESGVGQGAQIVNGLLQQATTVEDLNQTETDSVLDAQGDVFAALKKMVRTIPFRYRVNATIEFGMTSHFYEKASESTFTFDNGMTEWESFWDKFITKGIDGFRVSKNIIVSDRIFEQVGDAGGSTDDRLFAAIFRNDICERAISRGIGVMGKKTDLIGNNKQAWGARFRACVHRPEAVLLSEKIVYS